MKNPDRFRPWSTLATFLVEQLNTMTRTSFEQGCEDSTQTLEQSITGEVNLQKDLQHRVVSTVLLAEPSMNLLRAPFVTPHHIFVQCLRQLRTKGFCLKRWTNI